MSLAVTVYVPGGIAVGADRGQCTVQTDGTVCHSDAEGECKIITIPGADILITHVGWSIVGTALRQWANARDFAGRSAEQVAEEAARFAIPMHRSIAENRLGHLTDERRRIRCEGMAITVSGFHRGAPSVWLIDFPESAEPVAVSSDASGVSVSGCGEIPAALFSAADLDFANLRPADALALCRGTLEAAALFESMPKRSREPAIVHAPFDIALITHGGIEWSNAA